MSRFTTYNPDTGNYEHRILYSDYFNNVRILMVRSEVEKPYKNGAGDIIHPGERMDIVYGELIDKLGEYEDTGLEPAEIDMLRKENEELKRQLEDNTLTHKTYKLNLNDTIRVKLNPLGADIYYHQYDNLNGLSNKYIKPSMPRIDADGYTEMQLHQFMNIYGDQMRMSYPDVLETLDIFIDAADLEPVEQETAV